MKRMWLPRFTLRWAFLIVTLCAFVALIAGRAVAGKEWAIAVVIALGGAVFFFLVYSLFYVILHALPVAPQPASRPDRSGKTSIPRSGESAESLA